MTKGFLERPLLAGSRNGTACVAIDKAGGAHYLYTDSTSRDGGFEPAIEWSGRAIA